MTGSLAALLLAASLAACAGDPKDQPTTLPPITAAPTPSGTSPSPTPMNTAGMSDDQQIRAVYTGLVRNFLSAHGGQAERRRYYSQWAVDPALSRYARARPDSDRHVTGRSVPHIVKIEMRRRTATVYDCSDSRGLVVRDTSTGKVLSHGRSHVRTFADLRRTAHGWRVYQTDAEEGRCERTSP